MFLRFEIGCFKFGARGVGVISRWSACVGTSLDTMLGNVPTRHPAFSCTVASLNFALKEQGHPARMPCALLKLAELSDLPNAHTRSSQRIFGPRLSVLVAG